MQRWKEAGLCPNCGKPVVPGTAACQKHLDYYKRHQQKRRYKLTEEQLDELLAQDTCAICGSTEKLCIDHDHRTGEVRSRLCFSCNLAIGHLKDDPVLALRAAEYLLRYRL